jgi:hypothetical protein
MAEAVDLCVGCSCDGGHRLHDRQQLVVHKLELPRGDSVASARHADLLQGLLKLGSGAAGRRPGSLMSVSLLSRAAASPFVGPALAPVPPMVAPSVVTKWVRYSSIRPNVCSEIPVARCRLTRVAAVKREPGRQRQRPC